MAGCLGGDDEDDKNGSKFVKCNYPNTTYSNDPIPLSGNQTTRLDFSSMPGADGCVGQMEALGNMAMRWEDTGTLTWKIDVEVAEQYQIGITFASLDSGVIVKTTSGDSSVSTELPKSNAPFEESIELSDITELNMDEEFLFSYDRHLFEKTLTLEAGTQKIKLKMSNFLTEEVVDFRALEITPSSALESIAAEEAEAQSMRASTEWMVDANYGVMFHWTDMVVNEDGTNLDYKTAVEQFNVETFGELCESVGAGYIIFTLNHQYPHFPAPLDVWEEIHPGWTTERDLVQEIATDLKARDIPLVLYLASHLVGNPDGVNEVDWLNAHQFGSEKEIEETTHFDIFENNKRVLTAVGDRYGEDIAGFWLDGWDLIPETYPHPNFRELFEASKTGNPDRVVTFNRWVFPTVTPWQDYWAGEIDSPDKSPTEQYMSTEVGMGLQFQALIAMEDDWVYTSENLEDEDDFYQARYEAEDVLDYVSEVNAARGAVTINLSIRQDLSITEEALEIMKEIKASFD